MYLNYEEYHDKHNRRKMQPKEKPVRKRLKTPAQEAEALKKKQQAEAAKKQQQGSWTGPRFGSYTSSVSRISVGRIRGATPPPITREPLSGTAAVENQVAESQAIPQTASQSLPTTEKPRLSISSFFSKSKFSPRARSVAENSSNGLGSEIRVSSLSEERETVSTISSQHGNFSRVPVIIIDDESEASTSTSLSASATYMLREEPEEDLEIDIGNTPAPPGRVFRHQRSGRQFFPAATSPSADSTSSHPRARRPRARRPLPKASEDWMNGVIEYLGEYSEAWDPAHPIKGIFKQWVATRHYEDLGDAYGTCGACGHHPIRYEFEIKNTHNGNTVMVGSECIKRFASAGSGYRPEEEGEVIYGDEAAEQLVTLVDRIEAAGRAHDRARREEERGHRLLRHVRSY